MKKEFDLFKVMTTLTIVVVSIAGLLSIDFSGAASFSEFGESLRMPLELKNWHYFLLLFLIWSKK